MATTTTGTKSNTSYYGLSGWVWILIIVAVLILVVIGVWYHSLPDLPTYDPKLNR